MYNKWALYPLAGNVITHLLLIAWEKKPRRLTILSSAFRIKYSLKRMIMNFINFIELNQSGSRVSEQELNYKLFEWAMGLHRKGLKISGLWLYPKSAKWYIKILMDLHALVFAASVIIFFSTPEIFALFRVWSDLTLVVDNFLSFIPVFSGQVKLLVLWTKRKGFFI